MRIKKLIIPVSLLLATTLYLSGFNPLATIAQENTPINPQMGSTSQNALDWNGKYSGIIPCADCEGIKTEIIINKDLSYTLRREYLGKDGIPFEATGNFSWNQQGSIITLQGLENQSNRYLVGENRLFQLDMEGNRITGQLADKYILGKENQPMAENNLNLIKTPWRLVELNGQKVENLPKDIYIVLENNNRMYGFGGCNNLIGGYELNAGFRLRFTQVASTQMACQGMDKESELFQVLQMVDNYNLVGDTLILNKARMAPLAKFEAFEIKDK